MVFHIAKYQTPHRDAENLIKDCVMVIINTKCEPKAAKQIEGIPLSDDSTKRRIDEMSVDEDQGLQYLKDSTHPFSLQIDESTEEASCSQLLDIFWNFFVIKKNELTKPPCGREILRCLFVGSWPKKCENPWSGSFKSRRKCVL